MLPKKISQTFLNDDKEEVIKEHFTRWFKWGVTTHEFWEIFFTDRRIIFAYVGETYTSFLLRGDASDKKREYLKKLSPEAILLSHRANQAVPYSQVEEVLLKKGSLLVMPRLIIKTAAAAEKSFYIDDRRYDLKRHLPGLEGLLPGKVSLR
ncbi:MAG: hypothetical protein ACPLRH_01935 [Desulfotomaculales bacterium]